MPAIGHLLYWNIYSVRDSVRLPIEGSLQSIPGVVTCTAAFPQPPPDHYDHRGWGNSCSARRFHIHTSYEQRNSWRRMQTWFPVACTTREVRRPFMSACWSDMVAPSLIACNVTLVELRWQTGCSSIFILIPFWSPPDSFWFVFLALWLIILDSTIIPKPRVICIPWTLPLALWWQVSLHFQSSLLSLLFFVIHSGASYVSLYFSLYCIFLFYLSTGLICPSDANTL